MPAGCPVTRHSFASHARITFWAVAHPHLCSFCRYGVVVERLPRLKVGLAQLVDQGVRAVFMGTRSTDPDGCGMYPYTPTTPNWPPVLRVCPAFYWSYSHVWQFLRSCELGYCKLYDQGYVARMFMYMACACASATTTHHHAPITSLVSIPSGNIAAAEERVQHQSSCVALSREPRGTGWLAVLGSSPDHFTRFM